MASLLILSGPNLNLLGTREPGIYGHTTLADIEALCQAEAASHGLQVSCLQSNHEGGLIDAIHETSGRHDGIILNAGAYTHTSVALADAIKSVQVPAIEVHLSNVHKREPYRRISYISEVVLGQIAGFGPNSYVLAVRAMAQHLGASDA